VTAASADENNYYPAISPDGSTVIFDRATGTTLPTHDSYNNPNARLFAVPAAGGTPVALDQANDKDGMTNSWPRWSPFVIHEPTGDLMYFTFSSTRDYGIEIVQNPMALQPQVWMAAFDPAKAMTNVDPSFSAFWMPYQDVKSHNHIAQWTATYIP